MIQSLNTTFDISSSMSQEAIFGVVRTMPLQCFIGLPKLLQLFMKLFTDVVYMRWLRLVPGCTELTIVN